MKELMNARMTSLESSSSPGFSPRVKTNPGYIFNAKRAHYYMSIMKKAHSKMRNNGESDESFKKRFTADRSQHFDILQAKEATFPCADGCSERASEFSVPEYQLKPSDGRKLNLSTSHGYLDETSHTSHSSWKGIISPMLQEAESPPTLPTLSRKSETMFTPSCTLHEGYTLTEGIADFK